MHASIAESPGDEVPRRGRARARDAGAPPDRSGLLERGGRILGHRRQPRRAALELRRGARAPHARRRAAQAAARDAGARSARNTGSTFRWASRRCRCAATRARSLASSTSAGISSAIRSATTWAGYTRSGRQSSWRIVRGEHDIAKRLASGCVALAEQINDDGARMEALFISQIVAFYKCELDDVRAISACRRWSGMSANAACGTPREPASTRAPPPCRISASRSGISASPTPHSRRWRRQSRWRTRSITRSPSASCCGTRRLLNKACRLGNEAQRGGRGADRVGQGTGASRSGRRAGNLYRAGGLVEQGRYQEAKDQLVASLPRFEAHGSAIGLPYFRSYLAEACLGLGELSEAQSALDSATAVIETSNERFHEPEVLRLRAVLAMRSGMTMPRRGNISSGRSRSAASRARARGSFGRP